MNTDNIGWFEYLGKEIEEKGVIAMMIIGEARKMSRLLASSAKNEDAAANELWPVAINVVTALVSKQVDVSAIKEQYHNDRVSQKNKAALEKALLNSQDDQQQRDRLREQQRRAWGSHE